MQELNRFLHYYTRFRNHENSQKLEEPLLNNVRKKMELLASSLSKGPKGEGT
jgi:ankyrin repeat/IBR domain-containing protein 1